MRCMPSYWSTSLSFPFPSPFRSMIRIFIYFIKTRIGFYPVLFRDLDPFKELNSKTAKVTPYMRTAGLLYRVLINERIDHGRRPASRRLPIKTKTSRIGTLCAFVPVHFPSASSNQIKLFGRTTIWNVFNAPLESTHIMSSMRILDFFGSRSSSSAKS